MFIYKNIPCIVLDTIDGLSFKLGDFKKIKSSPKKLIIYKNEISIILNTSKNNWKLYIIYDDNNIITIWNMFKKTFNSQSKYYFEYNEK